MTAHRFGAWLLTLVLPLVPAGCASHGKYTSQFKEEAAANMARLRAATQYDLASQHFHTGQLEPALGAVTESIALNGEVAQSQLLYGRTLLEMGRTKAAIAAFDRGMGLDQLDPEFPYYRGIALERLGRLEEALESYRAAAAIDPAAAQYHLAAVEVLVDLGRLDEARALLEGPDHEFESHAGFRQALGHVAMMKGRVDAAVNHFVEAVVLGPADPVLLEDLCRGQVAALRFSEAQATLRRLSHGAEYAQRPDLQLLHASCLIELDRPVEARAILLNLAERDDGSDEVEVWRRLVDVALVLDDDWLLRKASDRLIVTAPGRHEGYLALAIWQRKMGDLTAALRSVDKAIDRADGDPTPQRLAAIIHRQLEAEGDAGLRRRQKGAAAGESSPPAG